MNNAEVVDFVIKNNIRSILGNHEMMFYSFFYDPDNMAARSWIFNGSESTIKSYDQKMELMRNHLLFLIDRPLFFCLEDCLISHAGISLKYKTKIDGIPCDSGEFEEFIREESANDYGVLWNRDKLLNIGRLQIIGHTRQKEVRYDKKSDTYYIDTGAYSGNKLSAVIIHNNQLVEIIEKDTDERDIR
jgi:serine/threonine protein phosphatase 1